MNLSRNHKNLLQCESSFLIAFDFHVSGSLMEGAPVMAYWCVASRVCRTQPKSSAGHVATCNLCPLSFGSARSDFLARCEEDWVCLWHYADHAALAGGFQCHQCGFLPHPGSSLCHHQLQGLQVCHPSCTEIRRGPSIQVS